MLEEEGIITAWLRLLRGNESRFSMLVHPQRPDAEAFLETALAHLKGSRPILCLAPSRGDSLSRLLRALAFAPVEDYVIMAKRTARLSEELAPETVGTAVTVS